MRNKFRRILVVSLLSLVVVSPVFAEYEALLDTWKTFFSEFATTTTSTAALSTLPAPIGSLVPFLLESPEIVKKSLIVWLHTEATTAAIADDWDAYERYTAAHNCLAFHESFCDAFAQILGVEEAVDREAAEGWRVSEATPLVPSCTDERISVEVPGNNQFIYRLTNFQDRDREVVFEWSDPFYDDGWLWIELKLVSASEPTDVALIATFEHSGTFQRRMRTFRVSAVTNGNRFEVPGIPITEGIEEVTITLDFYTGLVCAQTFEEQQVQRFVVTSTDD